MATQDQQNNNSIPTSRQSLQSNLPQQTFKIRGMKTDLSESSFENDFAFENKNMRINIVDDDNTLMNLTNEKGTKKVLELKGIPIGVKKYANDKILVCTTNNPGGDDIDLKYSEDNNITSQYSSDEKTIRFIDKVYEIKDNNGNIEKTELASFQDTANFSASYPLEIEHFHDGERDSFYLVDGINNFKCFNVNGDTLEANLNKNIEYNAKISGRESISISQIQHVGGEFYSGVIVYCYALITKLGHKTNIIDISDIIYLTNYNLGYGLEPNKRCNIANKITISNLNGSNFSKVEIFSLFRSTLNGEITVRKVCESNIESRTSISYIDINQGELWSYQELVSRFNSVLIPSTITQKGNALFLGNIKTNNYHNIKDLISNCASNTTLTSDNDVFLYDNQYFYGLQFQDVYGNWSPVIYAGTSNSVYRITLSQSLTEIARNIGFVSVRACILDNKRIRNTICDGISTYAYTFENGKYGIDYYAPYQPYVTPNDIYLKYIINSTNKIHTVYSPDIEFDENFILNDKKVKVLYGYLKSSYKSKIDVTINSNLGVLYKNNNVSDIGKAEYKDGYYWWTDSIVGYQKALQLLFVSKGDSGDDRDDDLGTDIVSSLYKLDTCNIKENPSKYRIYLWQPSGSLNDSNGQSSVLRNKRISTKTTFNALNPQSTITNIDCYLYDGTSNNIPVKDGNEILVYGGSINQRVYPKPWNIDELATANRTANGDVFWDDEQISIAENYTLATFNQTRFVGQPIEIKSSKGILSTDHYPALLKAYDDYPNLFSKSLVVRDFRGDFGTSIGYFFLNNSIKIDWDIEKKGMEYGWSDGGARADGVRTSSEFKNKSILKIRVTNNHNRTGSINMCYKTTKHLVLRTSSMTAATYYVRLKNNTNQSYSLSNKEIESGQWIPCSKKTVLGQTISVNINEKFIWKPYECLMAEPYSLSDENQITSLISASNVSSYINPMCRYDNLRDLDNLNGVTSSVINKINPVYNQKNNFFIFSGITNDTITDDTLDNTILYSDSKVFNEENDSFVNFPATNFYTIDSNINVINKLITFNDKLLCFSDNAIVQILYNENVVINTDSVQSLGLASTDKITGSQLISNTYGCLNKWSMGIYNNALYFNDDLNKKILVYNGDFVPLNESLGIETLNNKFFKNKIWNPSTFCNTKLNIDKYSKDVHYTTTELDIALNVSIGSFTSLYSYDNIPYFETIGQHSIALEISDDSNSMLHLLREGQYNYFFEKFEPYWTTVIMNQNSLANKMLSNIEFSTEAYNFIDNTPNQNFTFDHISFWNDYQENKMAVNYKMYGQSLLKKKFRVWRINRFKDSQRLLRRNYDRMANTWHYLKLSCENENNNKLTFHWLNINYL